MVHARGWISIVPSGLPNHIPSRLPPRHLAFPSPPSPPPPSPPPSDALECLKQLASEGTREQIKAAIAAMSAPIYGQAGITCLKEICEVSVGAMRGSAPYIQVARRSVKLCPSRTSHAWNHVQ